MGRFEEWLVRRQCGVAGIPGTDLRGIDAIVYEGAGFGFDGEESSMPEDEDELEAFFDEMVD